MSDPFLGEIKIVSFVFAPRGWALCNGQFLPINQNQALFALFGTTYGGNGMTTFALPDLRGRVPIHAGNGHTWGERAGSSAVTVTQQTLPSHSHAPVGDKNLASAGTPVGNYWAAQTVNPYWDGQPAGGSLVAMNPASVTNVGGSQPHENRMPFLTLSFIVALQGIFPSQN